MPGTAVDPSVLAARRWVDEAIAKQSFGDLPHIQSAQEDLALDLAGKAVDSRRAARVLRALAEAARDCSEQSKAEGLGIVVEAGSAGSYYSYEHDFQIGKKTLLACYGGDDQAHVLVYRDEQLLGALGESTHRAHQAFHAEAERVCGASVEIPEDLHGVAELTADLAEQAEARRRLLRCDARIASERAGAAAWRRANPGVLVAGLTVEQARLVMALVAVAAEPQWQGGGQAPSRDAVLQQLQDGGAFSRDRARDIASEILIPWPLLDEGSPGGDLTDSQGSGQRALYLKGGPRSGRLPAEKERTEADVLVRGAAYLRPLAEQVLTELSG